MRQSSAPPAATCQIMREGRPLHVCAAVAEAVRAHKVSKSDAEAAQVVADSALTLLGEVCRDVSVNRWRNRIA